MKPKYIFTAALAGSLFFNTAGNIAQAIVVQPEESSITSVHKTLPFPKEDNLAPAPKTRPLEIAPNPNGNVLAQDPQVVRPHNFLLPANYTRLPIFGEAEAAPWQAICFLESVNPKLPLDCTISELVKYYWQEAQREGVRPDLAFAQAIVETGYFRFGGDVHADQNNFCGLGTVGGGAKGARFATPELGARAHIQHLLAYTTQKHPSTPVIDPRYKMAHALRTERGYVDTWYGLNGTWAMGHNYAEKIFTVQQKMLAFKPSDIKPLAAKEAAGHKQLETEKQRQEQKPETPGKLTEAEKQRQFHRHAQIHGLGLPEPDK